MAIAIALSFAFRLNKALVLIAANISLPPFIPFILYLSHVTGYFWMGENARTISFSSGITFALIQESFLQYVLGAITLAIVAGVIFGLATYLSIKIFRKTTKMS